MTGQYCGNRRISLTFDDGPVNCEKKTTKILDILRDYDIKATFFVMGKRIEKNGFKILERIRDDGHNIGNHSYNHPYLSTLNRDQIRNQLFKTENLILKVFDNCKYFRPPYGDSSRIVESILPEFGYEMIMWTVDTSDWKYKENGEWVSIGIEQITNRADSLVLLHDTHDTTAQYLEKFINSIIALENVTFHNLTDYLKPNFT